MTLRDFISVIDRETLVCVCDDLGPATEVEPLKDIPLVSLMYDLNRKVQRAYIDNDDNSLTIILEDFKASDYPNED